MCAFWSICCSFCHIFPPVKALIWLWSPETETFHASEIRTSTRLFCQSKGELYEFLLKVKLAVGVVCWLLLSVKSLTICPANCEANRAVYSDNLSRQSPLTTSHCRESLWAIWGCLLMTLAWLEVAAMLLMLFTGTQWTVAAHKEEQRGWGQGAWWTSILMPSSVCVLLPWAPAEVQTEQPDPSGRAPLSSYQHIRSSPNCHETSQKMSRDVLWKRPLMFQESDVWGRSLQKFTLL